MADSAIRGIPDNCLRRQVLRGPTLQPGGRHLPRKRQNEGDPEGDIQLFVPLARVRPSPERCWHTPDRLQTDEEKQNVPCGSFSFSVGAPAGHVGLSPWSHELHEFNLRASQGAVDSGNNTPRERKRGGIMSRYEKAGTAEVASSRRICRHRRVPRAKPAAGGHFGYLQ